MHEPVGRVHFVVFEKFTSDYLFQIGREKSCDYLLIIYTKNITTTTNFDSAHIFSSFNRLAETDYYLWQIHTFSRPMLSNHSAKNLEMCKDWFYLVTSLLKITRVTIISKSKGFWIHPRLQELGVYKKFLQEVYCCFEIRKTLWVAKDKRHLLSCLMTLHHCLFLRPHHSWIHGEIFEIYNLKMKEAICFLLTPLPWMGERSHSCCDVGNCQY